MNKSHHHGNLAAELLKVGESHIRHGSPDTFSVRAAARQIGVSPGAAYRHFSSKEDLLKEVASRGFDKLAAKLEQAVPFESKPASDEDAKLALVRLFNAYVDFAEAEGGLWHLMFGGLGLDENQPTTQLVSDRPMTFSWLSKVIGDLAETRAIATVPERSDAQFAWFAIHGLASLISQGPKTFSEQKSSLVDLVAERVILSLK